MTVTELIQKLETLNPDMMVLLSSDEEGNSFGSLEDLSLEYIEKTYTGGPTDEIFVPEDLEEEATEDRQFKENFKQILILWP